ncbi:MAG: EVE domain-containing protein [Nitrospirae bacterium]|nr:MAG: EVE domain-containing protein [Nitrospirota bacterium]
MSRYWLMKSEPTVFSFDDLRARPGSTDHWEGVRNYQARNNMREMQRGDLMLFYHSNCELPGVVGIAEIVREAYPDFTAFDPASHYYDPKSLPEVPRWFMVDVKWKEAFKRTVSLREMREVPELRGMLLLRKGQRLSVMPVTKDEFEKIRSLGRSSGQG